MKVLVVGSHHDLQRIHSTSDLESGRKAHIVQSPLFRQWLESKTTEVGARFIAEEIDESARTVAQEVAQRRSIDRANIDMSKRERERRGIMDNYWTLHKLGQISSAQAWTWNRQREEFMLSVFWERSEGSDSAILLCGRLHVCGLTYGLRRQAAIVTTYDLRRETWYEEWHWSA